MGGKNGVECRVLQGSLGRILDAPESRHNRGWKNWNAFNWERTRGGARVRCCSTFLRNSAADRPHPAASHRPPRRAAPLLSSFWQKSGAIVYVREEWMNARDDEEGFDAAGDVAHAQWRLRPSATMGACPTPQRFPRTSGGCASLRCDCRVTPRCRTSHGGSSVRLGSAPREHESPATVGASARNLRPHKLRGRPSSHLFRVAVRATARRALATAHGVHDARAPKAHCPTPPPFQSLKGARGSHPACRAVLHRGRPSLVPGVAANRPRRAGKRNAGEVTVGIRGHRSPIVG